MTVRSFQAKIRCTSPEQRRYLEITHELFNTHLRKAISILYAARRGKHGQKYADILATVKNAQGASAQVEAITSLDANPGASSKTEWKETARKLLDQRKLLFDRKKLLPGFSSEFRRKIFETSFAIILSHEEKLKQWRIDHEEWLTERKKWEEKNNQYLAVRPIIQKFAEAEGKVSKRRGRWHRWLDFLNEHPELAAWRGGPATCTPLTKEELAKARSSRHKPVAKAFEMFWAKNPELKEVDRLHGEYERLYVRSWTRRRNPDGFRHPPTFTLPSSEKHPAWFSFKKGPTYRNLDLRACTIELKVLKSESEDERSPHGFTSYEFAPDPRLRQFLPATEPVKDGRLLCDLLFHNCTESEPRPATVQGVKLVFRNHQAYLYFSVFISDPPSRLSVQQRALSKYSSTWCIKKIAEESLDPPLRTMAIDLGIRHIAVATIMESDKLIATRFIHNNPVSLLDGRPITGIANLGQIAIKKKLLRTTRSKRGKPVRSQFSCKRLQSHLTQMAKDRFKKSAAAIVDVGRANKVDLILMESLDGLVPDAERERGINRALIGWNRRNLADWLKLIAEGYGIRVLELPPYWTSQICHRCDSMGQRYSVRAKEMNPEPVGKLFACPSCGYRANADFNASINLHRIVHGTFPEVKKLKNTKGKVSVNGSVIDLQVIRNEWQSRFALPQIVKEAPF